MKKIFYYDTVIGKIGIAEEFGFITNLYYMNMKLPLNAKQYETEIIREAYVQVTEYLNGSRKEFDIPLNPSGSGFQQKVWSELLNIPYGKTVTYKDIAGTVATVKSSRAAGSAINKNPIPIIIPCHRVIGADGGLVGYVGGLELKQKLLEIEGCLSVGEGK